MPKRSIRVTVGHGDNVNDGVRKVVEALAALGLLISYQDDSTEEECDNGAGAFTMTVDEHP